MNPKLFPLLVVLAVLAGGCRTHYTITLSNLQTVDAYSKPKLQGGVFVFKDANGQPAQVSAGRVQVIERD